MRLDEGNLILSVGTSIELAVSVTSLSYPSDPRGAFQGAVRACEAPLSLAEINQRKHYSIVALIGTASSAPPKVHACHDV